MNSQLFPKSSDEGITQNKWWGGASSSLYLKKDTDKKSV
jgi:hypothetical protein